MEISKIELVKAYGLLVEIAVQWKDDLDKEDERVTNEPLLALQKWFIEKIK